MNWHYLPELAAEYLAGTCSAGDASVLLKSTSTLETCCSPGSETGICHDSQSGTTFAPSTAGRGEAWLTSYRAAFRAKTFRQPEKEQESTEPEAAFGEKWQELSVRYDRDSCSWKTHRCLWEEDLPWSSVILPKSGMTRSGILFQRLNAERRTEGRGSGSWPTPTAHNYTTPGKGMIERGGRQSDLAVAVRMWPTPTVCGNYNRKGSSATSGDGLATAVGGTLNPTWVEWLMGWPLGWTALKPLATDKFQSWQQQHSGTFATLRE